VQLSGQSWLKANETYAAVDFSGNQPFRVDVEADLTSDGVIFGYTNEGSGARWHMFIDHDYTMQCVRPGGNPERAVSRSPVTVNDGTKHLYSMEYDGNHLRGLVDNEQVTLDVIMTSEADPQIAPLMVGAGLVYGGVDRFCNGTYYSISITQGETQVAYYDFSAPDQQGRYVNVADSNHWFTYTTAEAEKEKALKLIESYQI
jgi:hypothetical protein